MNNMSIMALVLICSPLLARREIVREIAQDIQQSEYTSAKVHLGKLNRHDLPKGEHKHLLKDFLSFAQAVRKEKQEHIKISNSWIDSLTALTGLTALWYCGSSFVDSKFPAADKYLYVDGEDYGLGVRPVSQGSRGIIPRLLNKKIMNGAAALLGGYMTYKGITCWYQNRCLAAAKKVEDLLEETLTEVKEG